VNNLPSNRQGCTIVVDLKLASNVDPTVRAATTLAVAVGASIRGLFIKEESMIDLAGLPFARAFTIDSGRETLLSPEMMADAINRHAAQSKRILSSEANKAKVSWSFSEEKGDPHGKINEALAAGDYLVLAGNGHGLSSHKLIKELRSSPSDTRGVVITFHKHNSRSALPTVGPVIAIDDGDEIGADTVTLAARIAEVRNASLHLIAIATTDQKSEQIINRTKELLGSRQTFISHRILPETPHTLAAVLMKMKPQFVVADLKGSPFNNDKTALSLFRAAGAPVVLLQPIQNRG